MIEEPARPRRALNRALQPALGAARSAAHLTQGQRRLHEDLWGYAFAVGAIVSAKVGLLQLLLL